jgi:acetyltransferase-like isoleucine patch superfamily enzyme
MEKIKYIFSHPFSFVITKIIRPLPYFSFLFNTYNYQCRVSLWLWFVQKVLNIGGNKKVYWPVESTSMVLDPDNILVGVDTCPGLMRGCYIQGSGGIVIGDYTQIGPNVVIVSSNHDIYDSRKSVKKKISIGNYCWLGAGCKIMPGVILGDHTIVGAGAVVTKSYPEGYSIIGGVPARLIKNIDPDKCIDYELNPKYYGYLNESQYALFKKKWFERNQ